MAEDKTGLRLSTPDITLIGKLTVAEHLSLAAALTIACLNLAAWAAPRAAQLFRGGSRPMNGQAALFVLLSVAALYFTRPRFASPIQRLGIGLALLMAVCCGILLAVQLGWGSLSFVSNAASWIGSAMTPQAAGAFALAGIAIALLPARRRPAGIAADFFTLCLLFAAAILVSGRIIGSFNIFGPVARFAISGQTLACLLLLAWVVFIRRAESGVFSILLGRGIGSKVARILTPLLLLAPYLREGLRAYLLDPRRIPAHYAAAFLATLAVAISMALLMYLAWRLNALESEIQDLSLRDPLTGLYNLRGFRLLAEQAMLLAHRSGEPFSVLFMDVDNLKQINDVLGHQAGSEYLGAISAILRDAFRETDVLGRIGGDEFAVGGQFSRVAIDEAAQRVQDGAARHRPHRLRFALGFSIGCATSDSGNRCSLAELLAQADEEMYREKRRRKAEGEGLLASALASAVSGPAVRTDSEPGNLRNELGHS